MGVCSSVLWPPLSFTSCDFCLFHSFVNGRVHSASVCPLLFPLFSNDSDFLKERLFAHVLRFRPVSSFRERMGVFSRPAPPSFAHVLRKIDFRPDVCEKRYRMRAILPVERQSIANTCVCLDLTESQKYLRLKISNGTRLYQIRSERQ